MRRRDIVLTGAMASLFGMAEPAWPQNVLSMPKYSDQGGLFKPFREKAILDAPPDGFTIGSKHPFMLKIDPALDVGILRATTYRITDGNVFSMGGHRFDDTPDKNVFKGVFTTFDDAALGRYGFLKVHYSDLSKLASKSGQPSNAEILNSVVDLGLLIVKFDTVA